VQSQNIEPQIAKSLGAAVLRVVMNVQFAEQKSSGGLFRKDSAIDSSVRLAFLPTTTRGLVVTPGSGKSSVELEELIALQGSAIKFEDATAGKDKAAEAMGNVITGLTTGSRTRCGTRRQRRTRRATSTRSRATAALISTR
jgi:hypothetical protein